jgi:hypothetical protein
VRRPSFLDMRTQLIAVSQIIKEELTFPSGTATAQLISILHRIPPPQPTTLRKRKGYAPVRSEEDGIEDEGFVPHSHMDGASHDNAHSHVQEDTAVREVVQQAAWPALVWSFIASGCLTVSLILGLPIKLEANCKFERTVGSILCPCRLRDPRARRPPCQGVALVLYALSLVCRARCVSSH